MSKTRERRKGGRDVPGVVLVVDDEPDIRELLELTLMRMGLEVDAAASVSEAKARLEAKSYDLCLTDMRMPDGEGLEVVQYISEHGMDIPVAVITAYGSTENAVAALKAGAFDYLSKPVSLEQLRTLVKSALALPNAAATNGAADRFVGNSPALNTVRELLDKVAKSQAPVYITGESGSGKELAARTIHGKGVRADKPFVPVNCGAIPENLMESEFFGYRKGAFTGADQDRDGFFQAANGGTLFLDEVADLPLTMQVKLLRAIQEKRVRKVGVTVEEPVDVRIISATHQNLGQLVTAGKFRQDLFYRLNVIEVRMPALREMSEDIAEIAGNILRRMAQHNGITLPEMTKAAQDALAHYDFPGNVRELENILERALALSDGKRLTEDDLQLAPPTLEAGSRDGTPDAKYPLPEFLDRIERDAIMEALEKTRFNRTAAAKLLGITFRAMRYRMERLGIK